MEMDIIAKQKQQTHPSMDNFTYFPSWLLQPAIVLLFSCVFIYTLRRKKSSMASPNLPPGPHRLPVIGNFHQILAGKDLHQVLWEFSHKYGPIMLIHLGSQPYVIISSSELANQVLKTYDHILNNRPLSKGFERLTFNYMDVAFSPSNDHWKKMRKVFITEFAGSKRTRFFKNVLDSEVNTMLDSFSSHLLNTTINLEDQIEHLITDVACKLAVGKSYREGTLVRGKTLKEILDELVIMLSGSLSDIFPSVGWILDGLRGWNGRLEQCFSDLDSFLEMVLDEHIDRTESERGDHEKDLIDACRSQLTRDELKSLLMNVINGSVDTTTAATIWAVSEIIKNPRVMQKLQGEIRSCVGRKPRVDESDITQMTYLKLVVKETLRLHPPPFLLVRECTSHCQIDGYDILPRTRILINSWGIGRDPKIWKVDATDFNPERLENLEVDQCEMVPFGGGRRSCPAANMATSIIEFTVASIFYSFDWKIPNEGNNENLDMEQEGFPVVKRKVPLCLVPMKHNWED
ncbi:hypothetical protein Lser_V15G05262 [Lactuca serriola]